MLLEFLTANPGRISYYLVACLSSAFIWWRPQSCGEVMHVVASVGITPCSVASLFASCSLHYAKSDADRMQTAVGSVLQGCKHGRIVPKLGQMPGKSAVATFTLALGGLNRLPTSFLRSNLFAGRSYNKVAPGAGG